MYELCPFPRHIHFRQLYTGPQHCLRQVPHTTALPTLTFRQSVGHVKASEQNHLFSVFCHISFTVCVPLFTLCPPYPETHVRYFLMLVSAIDRFTIVKRSYLVWTSWPSTVPCTFISFRFKTHWK